MSRLIILRGNSGSGKSSTALKLQRELGYGTMLIQQDVVRREILRIKGDAPGNPTVKLIEQLAHYGKSIGYTVIIEGILQNSTNQEMLVELTKQFDDAHVYYFDISFDETVLRHQTKTSTDFGPDKMREWWRDKDYLDVIEEKRITDEQSADDIVRLILDDVRNGSGD